MQNESTPRCLVVTAFEPFGGETVNAAQRALALLPEEIGHWKLIKRIIPVVFGKGAAAVIAAAEEAGAEAVLCLGQAAGRAAVTPELVGINLAHAPIPDNEGNQPQGQPIFPGEKEACFSPLPVRRMAEAIQAAGVAGQVSYSAGAYVCNDVLYRVLRHFENTPVRAGFIHVPVTPEQGEPSLASEKAAAALAAAIKVI